LHPCWPKGLACLRLRSIRSSGRVGVTDFAEPGQPVTEHFYACSDPYRPGPSGEGDRTREKREGERFVPKKTFRDEK